MDRVTVATTTAGLIQSVSPGFLALVGQPVEELAGISLVDLMHPEDAALARGLLGDAGDIDFSPTARLRLFQSEGAWEQRQVSVRTADDGRRVFELDQLTPPAPAPATAPMAVPEILDVGAAVAPDAAVHAAAVTAAPPSARAAVERRALGDRISALRERLGVDSLGPWVGFVGVVALAFVLRTWDLTSLPTGFHGDEGVTGQEAERILEQGSIGVYTGSALGQPTGPFYLDAITVGLFGNTIWATRILSAIAGTLAVAATYRIVERRMDHRIALASAFALATMTWSIHFSRIAFGVAWWPLVVVLAVGAIDRAATEQTKQAWFIAGALSTLGVYVYNSHWSFGLPVIVFVVGWILLRLRAGKPVHYLPILFGGLGALIVGFPMLRFILGEDGFFNHFNTISRRNSPEWIEAGFGTKISLYFDWYWETVRTLFITPVFDGTDGTGINKPVPLAFAVVAIVGLVEIARRHRSTFIAMVLSAMFLLPATTILTSNAIARRTSAITPLLAIVVGIGAVALIDLVRSTSTHKRATRLAAIGLMAAALFTGAVPYFTAFRNNAGQQGVFTSELTAAADAIRMAEEDGPVYVNMFSPRHDFLYPTIDFLLDDTPGETRSVPGQGFLPDLDMTLSPAGEGRDQIFLLIGPYVQELDRLQETNPTGTVIAQDTLPEIIVYEVPKDS